jgi:hypothetical protein
MWGNVNLFQKIPGATDSRLKILASSILTIHSKYTQEERANVL